MPPNDDERLMAHFGDLTRDFQLHRETINRSVGLLATEIFNQVDRVSEKLAAIRELMDQQMLAIRDRLADDDRARAARQQTLDAALSELRDELRSVRRWQWLRVTIELVAVLLALALFAGARWL